ncbi:MAG: phage tail protein [Lachnospiraceae bacterium]|nr:phage tail protein [Lachnospiraceae bacterium]
MNTVKQETKDELVPAYTFEVYFGNQLKVGFAKVSNIGMGEDVDLIPDGDEGEIYMRREKRHRHHANYIVLERGMSTGTDDKAIRDFKPGVHLYNVMIMVHLNGEAVRMFSIETGVVTRCSFSDLDALRSEVMIRRMEIQHMGIEEVTV